jgi:hypothetical protein
MIAPAVVQARKMEGEALMSVSVSVWVQPLPSALLKMKLRAHFYALLQGNLP